MYPDADIEAWANLPDTVTHRTITPLQVWYDENAEDTGEFEDVMRRRMHYVIKPEYLWDSIAELARTLNGDLLWERR